jgi:hypothetical protein
MHHDSRDTLDVWLAQRRMPPAPDRLAERIILEAAHTPQRRSTTLAEWLGGLFADFMPRPAYVIVGFLTLGLLLGIGFSTGDPQLTAANGGTYLQDSLTSQGEVL